MNAGIRRSLTVRSLGVIAAAVSALVVAGCASNVIAGGPMASEDRDIDAVTTVVLQTSGSLSISEGEPALTVHAPSDALEHLTSEVNGDVLVLGVTTGITFGLGTVRYELTLPDLEALTMNGSGDAVATVSTDGDVRLDLNGSGDVEWTGLATDRVDVVIAGSGDVTLSGSAEELSVELDGSGNMHGTDLQAQRVDVVVNGSGDVDVTPAASLSVDIFGSGSVTYTGEPTLDTNITGSGDVMQR